MQFSSSSENYASSMRNSPNRWTKDENKEYGYRKTAAYNYSSTGGGSSGQINSTTTSANNNVDQLDVLLEDLKNERLISKEKDYGLPSSSYIVNEHEKSTSSTIPLLSEISTIKKTTKHSEPITNYSSNKYYNEYQRKEVVNEELPIVVRNTTKSTLDKEIDDISLPSSILPPPGTKVTTTVRTYTYEIPAGENTNTDYSSTLNRNIVRRNEDVTDLAAYELTRNKLPAASSKYHSESYTSTSTTEKLPPPVLPAANTSYHAESYSSSSKTDRLPAALPVGSTYHSESYSSSSKAEPHVVPISVPVGTNQIYEMRETREVSSSLVPPPRGQNIHNTIVYNVSSTQRSPSEPRSNAILPVPTENIYGRTVNRTTTTNLDRSLTPVPVPLPPNQESSLSSYHYSATTTRSGGPSVPDYAGPQGKPAPFPVERADYQTPNERTPTRVDDLMQSFESSDIRSTEVDSPHRKHEVDTSTASPKQQHVPSVNRAGKEVFYPPGHELMLSKHQEMSASQGGGRWAKGSGNYEYEAGAKSSSKSKSGATMVPVCLPLCCAMPCSIM